MLADIFMKRLLIALTIIALALPSLIAPAAAEPDNLGVSGVWLSPDWIMPGPDYYTEEEVRERIDETLSILQESGINTVFFETWLRGTSIAPGIEIKNHHAFIQDFVPGVQGLPVYRHLNYEPHINGREVDDPLQILIDEAKYYGIEVHAWCHAFYWKMDNTAVMQPWFDGPSMWNDLLANWLLKESVRLENNHAVSPQTISLMREAAAVCADTCGCRDIERLLNKYRIRHSGHPFGTLIREAMNAGAKEPDFLLLGSGNIPFPSSPGKTLQPIYVNPEHPEVQRRLIYAIKNISMGHPGLRGIHMDHFRYPIDGQGLPKEYGIAGSRYHYFSPNDNNSIQRYRNLSAIMQKRQNVLTQLMKDIKSSINPRHQLSAAVLPRYYKDRDPGNSYKLNGCDFAAQNWYEWPINFAVPMMYEYPPYLMRQLIKEFSAGQSAIKGKADIDVYPGVSHLQYAGAHMLDCDNWVFFDLKLAKDIKFEKSQTETIDIDDSSEENFP